MVAALFLVTIIIFLVVDFILRREDKTITEAGKSKKSPIFLSPEKALHQLANETKRLYHLSHSWAAPTVDDSFYVGYDKFIPTLFPSEIKIKVAPKIDTFIHQGAKIWEVQFNGHKISQLAPISGKVIDINAACRMDIALPTDQVEKSWIVKMKAVNFQDESNNLMNHTQATSMNNNLRDEVVLSAQEGHCLNDGGMIDPSYITNMSDEEWAEFINKFFPYVNSIEKK